MGRDNIAAQGENPNLIANVAGLNSTIYKLMYYAHDRVLLGYSAASAATNVGMLGYFEEAALFPSTRPSYNIGVDPLVAIYKINYKD